MERTKDLERDVEQGLGGAGRLKILRLLLRSHDHAFTRYEIGKTVRAPVLARFYGKPHTLLIEVIALDEERSETEQSLSPLSR
jgi:hypothetical protein